VQSHPSEQQTIEIDQSHRAQSDTQDEQEHIQREDACSRVMCPYLIQGGSDGIAGLAQHIKEEKD